MNFERFGIKCLVHFSLHKFINVLRSNALPSGAPRHNVFVISTKRQTADHLLRCDEHNSLSRCMYQVYDVTAAFS